jgi:hypothetical protein
VFEGTLQFMFLTSLQLLLSFFFLQLKRCIFFFLLFFISLCFVQSILLFHTLVLIGVFLKCKIITRIVCFTYYTNVHLCDVYMDTHLYAYMYIFYVRSLALRSCLIAMNFKKKSLSMRRVSPHTVSMIASKRGRRDGSNLVSPR